MPPKHQYCAQCGMEVINFRKVLRRQKIIVDLVEPHTCSELTLPPDVEKEEELSLTEASTVNKEEHFKDFDLVQKLNGLNPAKSTDVPEPGDQRPADQVKKPVTSAAPASIMEQIKSMAKTGSGIPAERQDSTSEDEDV